MNARTTRFLALPIALLSLAASAAGDASPHSVGTPLCPARSTLRSCSAAAAEDGQGRGGCPPRQIADAASRESPRRSNQIPSRSERDELSNDDLDRVLKVTRPTTDFSKAEQFEAMSGGATTTIASIDEKVFSQLLANLPFEAEQNFKLGKALFEKLWVSSPSSTQASDGLGPLYNARACASCHPRDGRGRPPEGAVADATSMFYRLARPPRDAAERQMIAAHEVLNFPDPVYGAQMQDSAVPGLAAEGRIVITYEEVPVTLSGGEPVTLRKPHYAVADLGYGAMDPETTLSPRVAPAMIGLGLVEAIHEADILANADPDDRNGDGISGRAALVRDRQSGAVTLGRFGWKAQSPTVLQQAADAFAIDIGISTPGLDLSHGDCTAAQAACLRLPTGVQPRLGPVEAPDPVLGLVTFYSVSLAVPARRKASFPETLKGKRLFYEAGCPACHTPKYVTRRDAAHTEVAFQLIWPYSDFLLHDMGEGLADGQPVGIANGREWRTPPLWGIGLTRTVSGHTFLLHDGRARNFAEAVLWHGGEAEMARNAFAAMSGDDRKALLTFLESL
ncbi:di-heme oxidoredictase family protein [Sinorhizobium alkalisoli]|uniref:di-heme oxidoreductase family protein n=1 Tax=Sinorhizobium alkalisoli TaxID=1752398 RepID=UPI001CD594D4|nr:di-heme oxidoredictase family protein [Sinorhizobium alkalisoli]